MYPDHIEALSRSLADSSSRRSLLKILGVGAAGTAVTAVGLNKARADEQGLSAPTSNNQLTDIPMYAARGGANSRKARRHPV